MVAGIVRYVAVGVTTVYGLLGSLFLIGKAFLDPGGWQGALLAAAWAVPLAGLAVLALRRPERAAATLAWITVFVMMFVLLLGSVGAVPRPPVGPVATVTVFALAVALGLLGLHRPWLAGMLLLGAGGSLAVASLLGAVISGIVDRQGLHLDGSSEAVAALALVVGALFLLAGGLEPAVSGQRRSGSVGDALRGGTSGLQPRDRHPER